MVKHNYWNKKGNIYTYNIFIRRINFHTFHKMKKKSLMNISSCLHHPIRVVEQGNYHVIVYLVYSGVQHPLISMLFIP